MRVIVFISIISILLISCSSFENSCDNGDHCSIFIENKSNVRLIFTISSRSAEGDTLLPQSQKIFHHTVSLYPQELNRIDILMIGFKSNFEAALSKCWNNSFCVYFFKYEDSQNQILSSNELFNQGKLLKRKDYTLEDLKANNWVITYP